MTAPTLTTPRALTARQLLILQDVADGDSHVEIADRHFITPHAVSTTMQIVRVKLRASNTANAVAIGVRLGVIV